MATLRDLVPTRELSLTLSFFLSVSLSTLVSVIVLPSPYHQTPSTGSYSRLPLVNYPISLNLVRKWEKDILPLAIFLNELTFEAAFSRADTSKSKTFACQVSSCSSRPGWSHPLTSAFNPKSSWSSWPFPNFLGHKLRRFDLISNNLTSLKTVERSPSWVDVRKVAGKFGN